MRSEDRRRDEFTHRLSSFLLKEADLELKKASGIKSHVLLIETGNHDKYILKRHKNKETLFQQWKFFKAVDIDAIIPFHSFPNGRKFLKYTDHYYTIAPFVKGRKLNYKHAEDRSEAVKTIKNFHKKARHIYIKKPVYKKSFLLKWHDRLIAFKQTEGLFNKYGYRYLFKDIVQTTEFHLHFLSQFPWAQLERKAIMQGEWVHGDVASHNFIQSAQQTFMIDFDLLHCTTQLYDFIQLGQRFLPYVKWEIEELIRYNMVPEDQYKLWAYAMAVPSDVLREWLHFVNKKPDAVSDYLSQLDQTWANRRYFFKNIESVLN